MVVKKKKKKLQLGEHPSFKNKTPIPTPKEPIKPKKNILRKGIEKLGEFEKKIEGKGAFAQPMPLAPIDPTTGQQTTIGTIAGAGAIASPAGFGSLATKVPKAIEVAEDVKVAGAGVKGQRFAEAASEIYGSRLGALMYQTGITAPNIVGKNAKSVSLAGEMAMNALPTTSKLKSGAVTAMSIVFLGWFVKEILDLPSFASMAEEKAGAGKKFMIDDAIKASDPAQGGDGNWQRVWDLDTDIKEIEKLEQDRVFENVPFLNNWEKSVKSNQAGRMQSNLAYDVKLQIAKDAAEGKTQEQSISEQRIATEKEIIRLQEKATKATIALWAEHDAAVSTNEALQLKETINAWEKHKVKILEMEKKAAEQSAAFWLQYTIQKLALEEESFKRRSSGGSAGSSTIPGIL